MHSINTSSTQSVKTTPYDVVFGPKSSYDNDKWQVLSAQDVVNEEDLPQDVIDQLKEYENQTSVVEVTKPLNMNNSLTTLDLVLQTSLDLTLPTALSSKFHMSPQMKKRQRSELLSNEQIEPIDTGKNIASKKNFHVIISLDKESNSSKAYSVRDNQRARCEAEAMDMTTTAKRRKLFHDALNHY